MRSVQLDFTESSSSYDWALHQGKWVATHPDQENVL